MKPITIPKLIKSITDIHEFLDFLSKFNIAYHDELVDSTQAVKDLIRNSLDVKAYKKEVKIDKNDWIDWGQITFLDYKKQQMWYNDATVTSPSTKSTINTAHFRSKDQL